jgi:DNA-directed RNA polymerase subunit beta
MSALSLSLPQNNAQKIMSSGPLTMPPPAIKPQPEMREFGDAQNTRKFIYDNALDAARNIQPLEDDKHILKLSDVDWTDPEHFSRKKRKQAVLTGDSVSRRMHGTWELIDKASGETIEKRKQVVARVPYLSSMGTFVHRGNEYTINNQQRLLPGVFARVKDNGELESHFNVLPGKGVSHRYFLDPEKGVFKLRVGQSETPLMPLIKAMGANDREIRDAWGDALWQSNMGKNDYGALNKLKQKFLRKGELGEGEGETTKRLVNYFNNMELDPEVTKRTLDHPHTNVNKESVLAATKKLLQVSRGEAEPDDRDHLAYQRFYGPEDLFAERISRDHGNVRKGLFRKVSLARSLGKMPSGALTSQIEQVLLGSGLAQALEEINPAEVFDKQARITRMGEGGIPSIESIPNEARSVQPSHMGFMDPLRTPESFRVGVDLHMARGARKGKDGRIYSQLLDKQGKQVWKSPQDIADSAVATPDVMKWDTKRVPVMKGGKLTYVPKNQIDYVLPNFEDAFSPLGNLIPLKSMVKGQRVAMGSRYLTQALPLTNAQAPFVQGALPGTGGNRSFEEEYGKHLGAVAADQDGRVVGIRDGVLKLQHADGTTKDVELYDHYPFNRKTYIHQTPLVEPGQMFKKGQTLVRSNYTDEQGRTALGTNLRVAYMPYKGYNFEDAQVISESAASKMQSEHMYHHDLEITDRHKVGRKAFLSLFPSKFERKSLDKLDDDGLIKVGQKVEYGEPLILAAKERDRAQNKIHKKRQAGYNDESVVWKHHDPGVVTDVVWGKNGPVVLAKSASTMQVGDKMSGRYGDKGVVAAIVPDSKMPHDANGKPYEVLLNPLGVITRTNPSQKAEAQLGKIAELTGKSVRVPDFEGQADMNAWVQGELAKHGLKDTEDLVDPETNNKIRGIATGNRFFMKLHHTAESKGQGRGSGGYSMDETPAKGGETGCFTGDTQVAIWNSVLNKLWGYKFTGEQTPTHVAIADIVENRWNMANVVYQLPGEELLYPTCGQVTDWFKYRVLPEELVTLTLENGQTISCTKNHEFVLKDGMRKLAGELQPDDDLQEVF